MSACARNTVVEKHSGFSWENVSLVLALLGLFCGDRGMSLLVMGLLAVTCGSVGLRRVLKITRAPYCKWTAVGGILLGGFLVVAGFGSLKDGGAMAKARKMSSRATATV